jgi:hypothetical protein
LSGSRSRKICFRIEGSDFSCWSGLDFASLPVGAFGVSAGSGVCGWVRTWVEEKTRERRRALEEAAAEAMDKGGGGFGLQRPATARGRGLFFLFAEQGHDISSLFDRVAGPGIKLNVAHATCRWARHPNRSNDFLSKVIKNSIRRAVAAR